MHINRYITDQLDPDSYKTCSFYSIVDIVDSYKFHSSGNNGNFEMRIILTRLKNTSYKNRLNLGFGVWNSASLDIDDLFETRNGDADEILATVHGKRLNFFYKIQILRFLPVEVHLPERDFTRLEFPKTLIPYQKI